jgi:hypothetical protein
MSECFTAITFQVCLRIYHQEGPRKQSRFEIEVTHQRLVYADNANLSDNNINIIKTNIEALFDTNEGVSLEVKAEKTKCMSMYLYQRTGLNHYIKMTDK